MEVVQQICHQVAVMEDGKVIEVNEAYELFADPQTPLAKQFVQTVHSLTLPERLLKARTGSIAQITFRGDSAEDSIISETIKHFKVIVNILHGQISYIQDRPLGILIVEIKGEQYEIERAIEFITIRTNRLEVLADVS